MTRSLLMTTGLHVHTPEGRPLLRDLRMRLGPRDRVAIVGRNGAGKSTLLRLLAGHTAAHSEGHVHCLGSRLLVPQQRAASPTGQSPGDLQRDRLDAAFRTRPDVLLLDEPTHDLDAAAIDRLLAQIDRWQGALVVVSHQPRVLQRFEDFFVVAESGCHHVHGGFDTLRAHLEQQAAQAQTRYVQRLQHLANEERHHETIRRRRERKKNLGRLHELGRCTSRAGLNTKRSLAQQSQTKRANIQFDRIEKLRAWAKATRRALAVELPLDVRAPALPRPRAAPITTLHEVSMRFDEQTLFEGINLCLEHERLAITGPNGAGKSTLLEVLVGQRTPSSGRALCDGSRIGYVSQQDTRSDLRESLLDRLSIGLSLEQAARALREHRFPFALAQRPLRDLSPGERMRASLLCLLHRDPIPELLVLDQPTDHLDFVGRNAVESLLRTWTGGLVVVSHDARFVDAIGVQERLSLGTC